MSDHPAAPVDPGAFLLQLLHRSPTNPAPPPVPAPAAAVGSSYAFPPHTFRPSPPPGFFAPAPSGFPQQNHSRSDNSQNNQQNHHMGNNSQFSPPSLGPSQQHRVTGENSLQNYGPRAQEFGFQQQHHGRGDNLQNNYNSRPPGFGLQQQSHGRGENSHQNYNVGHPGLGFPQQNHARGQNSQRNYTGRPTSADSRFQQHNFPGGRDGVRGESLPQNYQSNGRGGSGGRMGDRDRNQMSGGGGRQGYWKPVGMDEGRQNFGPRRPEPQGRPQGYGQRSNEEQVENYRRKDNGEQGDRMGERWGGRGGRSEYRPVSQRQQPVGVARNKQNCSVGSDGEGFCKGSQNQDAVQVIENGSTTDSASRGDVSEEQDVLADRVTESMVLTDNPDDKKARRYKDLRSDFYRGHRVSSQRMRIHRRETECRFDIKIFTAKLLAIYKSLMPADEEKEKQKQLLLTLEKLVAKEWPDAELHIYGSCANSFGFSNSDIDLCLAIDDLDTSKSEILLKLADILQADNLENVQALTHARVPIVKMMDPVTGISCDICINNLLAVVNTKLLRDYALIDERLPQLAFIVKHWAKSRGVNETYRGTLSSYAYVLMCIHFLQLRRPAILPCLQEMEETYVVTVDNIRCAYFDRVEELRGFGSGNKENIAYLLWAFFQYWAYYYDYTDDVVSVRNGCIISKRSKEWTRRVGNDRHLICIEDPFEITHDLGRVVDKFSIKILREEFERAAEILQYNSNPTVTLFEPYVPPTQNSLESDEFS